MWRDSSRPTGLKCIPRLDAARVEVRLHDLEAVRVDRACQAPRVDAIGRHAVQHATQCIVREVAEDLRRGDERAAEDLDWLVVDEELTYHLFDPLRHRRLQHLRRPHVLGHHHVACREHLVVHAQGLPLADLRLAEALALLHSVDDAAESHLLRHTPVLQRLIDDLLTSLVASHRDFAEALDDDVEEANVEVVELGREAVRHMEAVLEDVLDALLSVADVAHLLLDHPHHSIVDHAFCVQHLRRNVVDHEYGAIEI